MSSVNATCGLIIIDGAQAMLGTVTGQHGAVQRVKRVTSTIASRTRRGGSSAPRFARKRDGAELAFLRRVVEAAQESLRHVDALMLGGKAAMKCKLLKEMPLPLRSLVQQVVAHSGDSSEDGLRSLARHWKVVHQKARAHKASACLREFLHLVELPTSKHCYGVTQTTLALKAGAVDRLLLADRRSYRASCGEDLLELAGVTCASVFVITAETTEGALFCRGYQVGAILRWPFDFEAHEWLDVDEPTFADKAAATADSLGDIDEKKASSHVSTVSRPSNRLSAQVDNALLPFFDPKVFLLGEELPDNLDFLDDNTNASDVGSLSEEAVVPCNSSRGAAPQASVHEIPIACDEVAGLMQIPNCHDNSWHGWFCYSCGTHVGGCQRRGGQSGWKRRAGRNVAEGTQVQMVRRSEGLCHIETSLPPTQAGLRRNRFNRSRV